MRAQIVKLVKVDEDSKNARIENDKISHTEKKKDKRGSFGEYRDNSLEKERKSVNVRSLDREQHERAQSIEKELGEII